jgi:hypothetical protein
VYNFTESCELVNIRARTLVEFSEEHRKDRSPAFSPSIEQVPYWLTEGLVQTADVIIIASEALVNAELGQFLLIELSWYHFLHYASLL